MKILKYDAKPPLKGLDEDVRLIVCLSVCLSVYRRFVDYVHRWHRNYHTMQSTWKFDTMLEHDKNQAVVRIADRIYCLAADALYIVISDCC